MSDASVDALQKVSRARGEESLQGEALIESFSEAVTHEFLDRLNLQRSCVLCKSLTTNGKRFEHGRGIRIVPAPRRLLRTRSDRPTSSQSTIAPARNKESASAFRTAGDNGTGRCDLIRWYSYATKYSKGVNEDFAAWRAEYVLICDTHGLAEEEYAALVHVALTGAAKEYFTDELQSKHTDLSAILDQIKKYFLSEDQHRRALTE